MKRISNYIKSYCTFPGVHIRLKNGLFSFKQASTVTCIICHKTYWQIYENDCPCLIFTLLPPLTECNLKQG